MKSEKCMDVSGNESNLVKLQYSGGFSTIELAIVLAIVGIISCISIPSYMSWRANSQLRSAAREINSVFQRTRMEAIKQNTTLTIRFDSIGGEGSGLLRYRVFSDNGVNAGNGIIENDELSSVLLDDTVENINFPGLDNMAVAFNSRGMLHKYLDDGVDQGGIMPAITLRCEGSSYQFQVTLVRTGLSRIKVV